MNNDLCIYGKHPIFLALQHKKRDIFKIYTSNLEELKQFIKENNIKIKENIIEYKTNDQINKIIKEDVNHQGYLALASNHKKYNFDTFLNEIKQNNKFEKIIILDQLTDPHNIGAIIRSAVAFGVKYIITTEKNTPKDSSVIVKSSAGMSEIIDIIEVVNINNTIEELKKVGYFIIGMAGEAKLNLKTIKNDSNYCLVVGNEGRGIRQLVKKNCDILCKIEMEEAVESLNVSVATAIALYQLWSK